MPPPNQHRLTTAIRWLIVALGVLGLALLMTPPIPSEAEPEPLPVLPVRWLVALLATAAISSSALPGRRRVRVAFFVIVLLMCVTVHLSMHTSPGGEAKGPAWGGLRRMSTVFDHRGDRVLSLAACGSVLVGTIGDGSTDGRPCAWDVESGALLWSIDDAAGIASAVTAVPGESWFACGFCGESARAEIREIATGRLLRASAPYEATGPYTSAPIGLVWTLLCDLVVDPTGRRLIATGHPSVVIWSIADLRLVAGPVRRGPHLSPSFGTDGESFVTGTGRGRHLDWWDPDGNLLRQSKLNNVVSLDVAGSVIACCRIPGQIILVDYETGAEIRRLEPGVGPVNDVAFSPDGAYVFGVGQLGVLRAWEAETGRLVGETELGFKASVLEVAGKTLYVGGQRLVAYRWR